MTVAMQTLDGLLGRLEAARAMQRQRPDNPPGAALVDAVEALPAWPDAVRGVPNGVLRSALFGAIRKGARRYLDRERIAALDGIEIHYTGQRLDQGDLDVWESVLHIARLQAMGEPSRFTAYSLLKLMGKTDTGKNRRILHQRLTRLKANGVEVRQGRFSYVGSLIGEVYKDEHTQEYVVILNDKLRALFGWDQFTQIDWSVRQALDGKPLAQWLHGFYGSHARPYPMNAATLHQLCGSEAVRLDHFRQDLRKALDALAEASGRYGRPIGYTISGNLVSVKMTSSKTQRRHLARKVGKGRKGASVPFQHRGNAVLAPG